MSASEDLTARHRASVFFTWTAQREAQPLQIVSGAGAHFQTADGASWLDLGSMVWNAALGHGHAAMKRALVAAAERNLLAMLSLSGDPRRAPFDPGLPGGVAWNDPYSSEAGAGDLERVLAREDPKTVAAVLLEGVVGANGVYVPPAGYWKRVREVCDRHGVLLIADEVLSGFGRTGRWFAVDHDEVSPDILTCAKGLTAGYAPGGATLVTPAIAGHFEDHVLSCGLTAYAHPLTCAAIVAAIEAYRGEELIGRAERLGGVLEVQLRALAERRPCVREVRGLGLLWALELDARTTQMKQLAQELRTRHLHLHKRDTTLFVAPPLVIDEADLQAGVAALGEALDAVWAQA